MCGISGIVRQTGTPVREDEIRALNDLVAHRGPDGEGYFFGDCFAIGHRRLSIIDLSDAGNQPMTYRGRYTIAHNGEIYNYLELKDELLALGYEFNSETDTEVILASYDCWGRECVTRFNGMWAFALYDNEKRQIFCSRDRFGIKPFYYAETDGNFVFCSEIKQALAMHKRNIVNLPLLVDFLVLGLSDHTSETFFSGVHALRGGYNLVYDLPTHRFTIEQYYQLECDDALTGIDEKTAIERYRSMLIDSVRLRLRSDVRVGTCLSGGLDSSSVAAIAAENYATKSDQRFVAVTAVSTNPSNDESIFAGLVADSSNLDLNLIRPSNSDFTTIVEELIRVQEEPFGGPSLVMQYYVFRKAKELGCKVMLDGQGGDETLLGYERYYASYLYSLPPGSAVAQFLRSSRNSKLSIGQIASYLVYFLSAGARKLYLRRRNRFVKTEYLDAVSWEWLQELSAAFRNIVDMQRLELTSTQMPHLLRYEDRNSMAHSIESRLPFIDYRLVELALSLPNATKICDGWTKYVLRKSMAHDLPPEVSWRKTKFGFEAPANDWLRENRAQIQKVINGSALVSELTRATTSGLSAQSLWRLYFIAMWESVYDVQLA
jgi:asparagine synthase (glutamine-hydrolysing)